jgi:plastocyanin
LIALACLLQASCGGDPSRPTEPLASAVAAASASASSDRLVNLMDACDPATFNAAVGPGTCVRQGGVAFSEFLAQVTKHGAAGAWHFAPPNIEAVVGQTLVAMNRGGETHSFTEVEHFGGGIVPLLNQLSGNPVPAPECLALAADDFVPAGGTFRDEPLADVGTEHYQCCIHPWMRAEVHVRAR